MQTFLPYESFEKSAQVLDHKRLGKQRVECLQILNCLDKGEWTCWSCNQKVTHFNEYKTGHHCYYCEAQLVRTPWFNHPACQLWVGFRGTLAAYGITICDEWINNRKYKDNCKPKLVEYLKKYNKEIGNPKWLGNESFHLSHKSNLIRKKPEYYKPIFGDNVPENLNYVWKIE